MQLKTKRLFLLIPFISLMITGCEDEKQKVEDKIIGKWLIEETGVTENDMRPYDPYGVAKDDYFEFLPDKTVWHYCNTCVGEKHFQTATYKIDSEYYYYYTIGSDIPDIYYYSFYGDKLKITTTKARVPGNEAILITNIIIYKRKKH